MSKLKILFIAVVALAIISPVFAQLPTAAQTAEPTMAATASAACPTASAPASAATMAATPSGSVTIDLGCNQQFPKFLVGEGGMTLYIFTADTINTSNCNDKCSTAWPPVTVDSADKITVKEGIPGTFATIKRTDGTLQVTYNGQPLYYWFRDKKPGDTTGNRITRNWWIVPPATVYAQRLPKVGTVLVGSNGMTVYMFKDDKPDVSNCTAQCIANWPPVTVKTADDLVGGLNLSGKWNTIKRDDGTLQVTYNGWPLYYFKKDAAIGDANGEGLGNKWYTIVPETVTASANKDLGNILVSYDGMTLYTYAKDTAGTSTCTGDCIKNWPAFTVYPDDRLAAGSGVTGKLDTIKRDDGSLQVTYNGMPLYVFAKDKVPGDANGNNVGNVWSVVKP